MNALKLQQKTHRNACKFIVNTLEAASERDDYPDMLEAVTGFGPKEIDTSELTADDLMYDPAVLRAFRKFCTGVIGALQYHEEDADEE